MPAHAYASVGKHHHGGRHCQLFTHLFQFGCHGGDPSKERVCLPTALTEMQHPSTFHSVAMQFASLSKASEAGLMCVVCNEWVRQIMYANRLICYCPWFLIPVCCIQGKVSRTMDRYSFGARMEVGRARARAHGEKTRWGHGGQEGKRAGGERLLSRHCSL